MSEMMSTLGNWYFTFGNGQKYAGRCVRIFGTFSSTRDKMFEKFGDKWAFQYSEEDWKAVEDDPHRFWPMEIVVDYDDFVLDEEK